MPRPFPSNLRILFYADIHVGDYGNGRRYTDMIAAEEFITQLAIDRKVDWVAFVGDAFKSRNPHDEHKTRWLEVRAERSRRFKKESIRQIDLVGNHCRWYKVDDSGHVFEALEVGIDSDDHYVADIQRVFHEYAVSFYCLPAQVEFDLNNWTRYIRSSNLFKDSINICLFHGMVKGCSLNQSGTVSAKDGIPLEILDRPEFDWVMGGDIHIAQRLDFKHTRGGYVGSTLQLDATDVGESRGCMIVTFEQGATEPRVEFVPVPQAELKRIVWDTKDSFPDVEEYRGHLVTVEVRNSARLPTPDIDIAVGILIGVARHVNVVHGQIEEASTIIYEGSFISSGPIDDFIGYVDKIPNLDKDFRERVTKIFVEEVMDGEGT